MAGYTRGRSPSLRFHAVSIVPGQTACKEVLALKDVRLLSVEGPRVPLPNCTTPHQCDCRFQHHDDRRAGPRRQPGRSSATQAWTDAERRTGRGRRSTDFD